MEALIDSITGSFVSALQEGGRDLAVYSLPILSLCALISFYREYSATVMSSGAGLGDSLAHFVSLMFAAGIYVWIVTNIFDMGMAALNTVFFWGLSMAGNSPITTVNLTQPSFIMRTGMVVAAPIADFSNWWDTLASVAKLAFSPNHLIALWCVLLAFAGITLHFIAMLIEFHVALALSSVLLPWGIWRSSAHIGEFAIGWLTGALVRALTTSALVGIGVPLFRVLVDASQAGIGWASWVVPQSIALAIGAFIFCVCCFTIPAQAARLAGHASLGLTGSTFLYGAMTTGRFALMASSAASAGARVVSPLVAAARGGGRS